MDSHYPHQSQTHTLKVLVTIVFDPLRERYYVRASINTMSLINEEYEDREEASRFYDKLNKQFSEMKGSEDTVQ